MTDNNSNGTAEISTPLFHITANGSLMVILLGLVATAAVGYWMLDAQAEILAQIVRNQHAIIAGHHELACLTALPIEDRRKALAEDWCRSYLDRRMKSFERNQLRMEPPSGAGLGG